MTWGFRRTDGMAGAKHRGWFPLVAVVVLVMAACNGDGGGGTTQAPSPGGQGEPELSTVTLGLLLFHRDLLSIHLSTTTCDQTAGRPPPHSE